MASSEATLAFDKRAFKRTHAASRDRAESQDRPSGLYLPAHCRELPLPLSRRLPCQPSDRFTLNLSCRRMTGPPPRPAVGARARSERASGPGSRRKAQETTRCGRSQDPLWDELRQGALGPLRPVRQLLSARCVWRARVWRPRVKTHAHAGSISILDVPGARRAARRRTWSFPGSHEPGKAQTFLGWRASSSPNRTHFGGKRASGRVVDAAVPA